MPVQEAGSKTLEHALYSSNLTPAYFFLFSKPKEELRGIQFENREELTKAIHKNLKRLRRGHFVQVFSELDGQMQEIALGHDYVKRF